MPSIERCREILGENMPDSEVEETQDTLCFTEDTNLLEFKKDLVKNGIDNLSDFEVEKLHKMATNFSNFAYKNYINSRGKKV